MGTCCHHAGGAISGSPKGSTAVAVGMIAPGLDLGSKVELLEGVGGHQEGTLLSALNGGFVRSNTTFLFHPQVG